MSTLTTTRSSLMDPEALGKMSSANVREEISALEVNIQLIHELLQNLKTSVNVCKSKVEYLETDANNMDGRLNKM